MDILPPELHLLLLETCAKQSHKTLISLASSAPYFNSIYKRHERPLLKLAFKALFPPHYPPRALLLFTVVMASPIASASVTSKLDFIGSKRAAAVPSSLEETEVVQTVESLRNALSHGSLYYEYIETFITWQFSTSQLTIPENPDWVIMPAIFWLLTSETAQGMCPRSQSFPGGVINLTFWIKNNMSHMDCIEGGFTYPKTLSAWEGVMMEHIEFHMDTSWEGHLRLKELRDLILNTRHGYD